jgi:hypothetical protein
MFRVLRQAVSMRVALIGATLLGVLIALAMAASPALHERLHPDFGRHDPGEHHECLATLLAAGGCDDASHVSPTLEFLATRFEAAPIDPSRHVASPYLSFRILEHAPPRRA